MARSSIIDIGSVFDEYLLKEQHFEREIEERYIYNEIYYSLILFTNDTCMCITFS